MRRPPPADKQVALLGEPQDFLSRVARQLASVDQPALQYGRRAVDIRRTAPSSTPGEAQLGGPEPDASGGAPRAAEPRPLSGQPAGPAEPGHAPRARPGAARPLASPP